ncbi:MAG TPA: hypothetical protein VLA43_04045 [Longimicrobiales bacterium]|nr:hypothetical protein [Longimicrobiales bacterium]
MPNLPHAPTYLRAGALASLCLVAACMGRAAAPEPGTSQGTPPDLRGSKVMVLPFQDVRSVVGDPDAELAFSLQDRGPEVTWILPSRLQSVLDRSPGMTRIRGLPVGVFSTGEVRRIGDPLYGELRRLGAMVDGEVALIPLGASLQAPDSLGVAVRVSAAVIHVRTGRVLWFGMLEGDHHETPDLSTLASAVDALARTLLWYSGR